MHIRKGDTVLILSGNDKNKQGKVLKVFTENNRVIVEGINFIKRHTRPSQQNQQGGIMEREGTIHASNVMVICPGSGKPSRLSSKLLDGNEKLSRRRVRYSKKYDEIIPSGE